MVITDEMALAFNRALGDHSASEGDLQETKVGLRAAFECLPSEVRQGVVLDGLLADLAKCYPSVYDSPGTQEKIEALRDVARMVLSAEPEVQYPLCVECPDCRGSEIVGEKSGIRCTTCNGTGEVRPDPAPKEACQLLGDSGEVSKARTTSQYWKDEHLAGNKLIEELKAEVVRIQADKIDWVTKSSEKNTEIMVLTRKVAELATENEHLNTTISYLETIKDNEIAKRHIAELTATNEHLKARLQSELEKQDGPAKLIGANLKIATLTVALQKIMELEDPVAIVDVMDTKARAMVELARDALTDSEASPTVSSADLVPLEKSYHEALAVVLALRELLQDIGADVDVSSLNKFLARHGDAIATLPAPKPLEDWVQKRDANHKP